MGARRRNVAWWELLEPEEEPVDDPVVRWLERLHQLLDSIESLEDVAVTTMACVFACLFFYATVVHGIYATYVIP